MFERLASEDFRRAYRKAFWRKIGALLTGRSNELLPYDEVRRQLPFEGQRTIGLQTIPIDKIIGSVGRYRDFDRAFLPTQTQTTGRWVSIRTAHYHAIELPPVELYKIGEVYFVQDGNHRVSVARERGQAFIDAIVTEIDVPIPLTTDTKIDDLVRKRDYAWFLEQTGIHRLRPEADLELTTPNEYARLHEHINAHRWYLGEQRQAAVPYEEAVVSWYDNVYQPLVQAIQEHGLAKAFPQRTLTDLYWWVSEYQWLLREAYLGQNRLDKVTEQFAQIYSRKPVMEIIGKLRQATWIDQMILEQEQEKFYQATNLRDIRPDANIFLTLPGKYDKLLEHISVHRWYLGEARGSEVSYAEAVASWYDNVYLPSVQLIREQDILSDFPDRTEADLYLWVVDHREELEGVHK